LDPKSGKTIWNAALPKNKSNYYSSPLIADGKLYAAREDGVVFVVGIENGYELLSENDMGESVIAMPVPYKNHLLIRSAKYLFCFKGK
jgi:outer membrane protein assembly factor BamB